MRHRGLHDALRDFALEAAALLVYDVERGAELDYDLGEEPGGSSLLYHYRPLTREFIAERWDRLRRLPSCLPAQRALGSGARSYLRVRGGHGGDAEPALRAMLERLYEDLTSFGFPEERFERVYREVEETLFKDTTRTAVIAPLPGLELGPDERIELGEGLVLVGGPVAEAPPEAVWPSRMGFDDGHAEPVSLVALERDLPAGAELPTAEARMRFRGLLTALRLFKPGGIALAPIGWVRANAGPWQPFALGTGGYARGEPWRLTRGEAAELREFLAVMARARPLGAVAWALDRFEMGCDRALDGEAVSDYLLALRALLGDGDEEGRASLTLRLAALCAEERDRRGVQRRVEQTLALERFMISGGAGEAYLDEVGSEAPRAVISEIEGHLRALLRDLACGYLDPDLKSAADDILLESGAPIEIRARDLRRRPHDEDPAEPVAPFEHVEPPAAAGEDDAPERLVPEQPETDEPAGAPTAYRPVPAERARPGLFEADGGELEAAVTPSADWGPDEDADSYSAPV